MYAEHDTIVVIDADAKPVTIREKKNIIPGEGIYRNNFLFQLHTVSVSHFEFFTMYVLKVGEYYDVHILKKKKEIFSIQFKKLANVYLLYTYVNIDKVYFNVITEEIQTMFEGQSIALLSELFGSKTNTGLYKIYRYKFYLDANHRVSFKDGFGEKHPHTWEFVVEIKHTKDTIILFYEIEQIVEQMLAPYQGVLLNDTEYFSTVNPTTENIGFYFKKEFEERIKGKVWSLEKMEISETANRTFVLK